jgi:hypothetical protein
MSEHAWQTFLTILGGLIAGIIGLITGIILNKSERAARAKDEIESCKMDCFTIVDRIILDVSRKYELGHFYNSTKRRLEECIFMLSAHLSETNRAKIYQAWDEYDRFELSIEAVNAYHSPIEPKPSDDVYEKDQKRFLKLLNQLRKIIEEI